MQRLRWYLGKAGSANLTDTRREIEFSDISGLDAVRRINMNADVPQKVGNLSLKAHLVYRFFISCWTKLSQNLPRD